MYPGKYAQEEPNRAAYIMGDTGEVITYQELEDKSNQGAQLFRSLGLVRGDHIAIMMENNPAFFQIVWAAQRAGLYYTAMSYRLQKDEVEYIINNCEAKVFITSKLIEELASKLNENIPNVIKSFMVGGECTGFSKWETEAGKQSTQRIEDESEGADMLYSSGTTGRPKGIKIKLSDVPFGTPSAVYHLLMGLYVKGDKGPYTYLSPAPLYHAAPLRYSMAFLRAGATIVVMNKYEPEHALQLIEKYKVNYSQWVPTMFVRMLKLDNAVRLKYDVSSMKGAIHAAAPCPVKVKEQMIEWWGPVLYEYYAGTEGNGFTSIDSHEWLTHKGSVGKSLLGELKICDEEGNEVAQGLEGDIYFAGGGKFEYHGDEEKTKKSRHKEGWSTLGDVGYVDEEGYLYLTDRKAYMIISGGVNIYPQEVEDQLVLHPKVMDAAVFGVPNEDFGEEVKAVVQPKDWKDASPERKEAFEKELMDFCKEHISHVKCPRSIDFEKELPRHPTGKLLKRLLKDRYWKKD